MATTTDAQIDELLLRWDRLRREGATPSVEDLCREHPHLSARVRERLVNQLPLLPGLPTADAPLSPAPDQTGGGPAATVLLLHPGAEPMPGYRLVRLLGRGGFGEVWQTDGPGEMPLALKFVHLSGRAGHLERRALELIRNIRHPNLLKTFGTWEREDRLVIAMDLADGTLADVLRSAQADGQRGVPREALLPAMRQAAEAIDYLNSPVHTVEGKPGVSVQHRDIKPQNLLRVGPGVVVGDFGLARLLEQSIASHTGSLTPAYAAPEFFDGKTSRTSDQYGLAVTYCELRGGRTPFRGNLAQLTAGHLYKQPDLSMLPDEERAAVAVALSKEPDERWPSCKDFVEALANPKRVVAMLAQLRPTPGEVRQFAGETGGVQAAAFSPDGLKAATGGALRDVVVWDVATGREAARLVGHRDTVRGLAFAGEGELVTAGDDGSLRHWQLPAGEEAACHRLNLGKLTAVAAAGGKVLAGSLGGKVRVREAGRGTDLKGHAGTVHAVALSADGALAVAAGGGFQTRDWGPRLGLVKDCGIRVWDVPGSPHPRLLVGHADVVHGVSFAACGRHLISAGADGTLRVWELALGREVACLRGPDAFRAVACSPEGRLVVTGGADGFVRVWRWRPADEADGEPAGEVIAFAGHAGAVTAVAFAPDGRHALSAGVDGTVRLWRLPG